ncbi:MAG: SPOR domain-containing protein [Betaproteobacteria bacterium]|nr:SPOR domain-containing protein [Betaproteobacteria bacterium]
MKREDPLSNSPADADHEAEQRNVIVRRLTIAAVLIVGLLGLLFLFDKFSGAPEESGPPPFPDVVPVPQRLPVQPVTPPSPEDTERSGSGLPFIPDDDDDQSSPTEIPPEPPEIPPSPPETPPETPSVQPVPAPEPAPPERPAATTRSPTPRPADPRPVPQLPGVVKPEFTAPEQEPEPQPLQPPPVVRTPPPVPQPPAPVYVVQAGVFANFQRAEEIHAKLTLHGIPSTLETRIQVGPFKTQAEAEAARKKMRELGIEGIVLPPQRPRP